MGELDWGAIKWLTSPTRASSPTEASSGIGTSCSGGSVGGDSTTLCAGFPGGMCTMIENCTHLWAAVLFSTTSTPNLSRSPAVGSQTTQTKEEKERSTCMELFRIAFGATLTEALVVKISSIAAFGVLDVDL